MLANPGSTHFCPNLAQSQNMNKQLKIIEDINAAPLDPQKWTAVLDGLAEITDSKGSALLIERKDGWVGWRTSSSLEPQLSHHFLNHRETENTIINNWLKRINSEEFVSDEMLANKNIWMETPFMREYGIPNKLNHAIGTLIKLPTEDTVLIFSIREDGKPAYGSEERNKLNALRPYLMRAALLSSAIGASRLDAILNRSSKNGSLIIVLDSSGRVLKYSDNNFVISKFFVRKGSEVLKVKNPTNEFRFESLLAEVTAKKSSKSIPIKSVDECYAVMHLLPVESVFFDMFDMNNSAAETFEHTYIVVYIPELKQERAIGSFLL